MLIRLRNSVSVSPITITWLNTIFTLRKILKGYTNLPILGVPPEFLKFHRQVPNITDRLPNRPVNACNRLHLSTVITMNAAITVSSNCFLFFSTLNRGKDLSKNLIH